MRTYVTDIAKCKKFIDAIEYLDDRDECDEFCQWLKTKTSLIIDLDSCYSLDSEDLDQVIAVIKQHGGGADSIMSFCWRFRYLPKLMKYLTSHNMQVAPFDVLIEYIRYHRDNVDGWVLQRWYYGNQNKLFLKLYDLIKLQKPELSDWPGLRWGDFYSEILQYIDGLEQHSDKQRPDNLPTSDTCNSEQYIEHPAPHSKHKLCKAEGRYDPDTQPTTPRKIQLDSDDTITTILENSALHTANTELKTKYDALYTEQLALQTQYQELQTRCLAMRKVRHELHDKLDDMRAELELAQTKYDELLKKYTDTRDERDNMLAERNQAREERDETRNECNEAREERDALQNKFTELTDKYNAMVKKITEVHSLVE